MITDKDGNTTTVENTLVAVAPTEVAVADRGAVGCAFRRIEVRKFSDIKLPETGTETETETETESPSQ